MSHPRKVLFGWFVALCCVSVPVNAQPVGTFRWQMQPYCNVVTVNVAQQGGLYTLDGTDDRCGAAQSASAVGLAFLNPTGTVGFGLSIVLPGGTPVHVEATIAMTSLNGTWRDSAGNSGAFIFTPAAGSGGAPRPVPAGGVAPASITSAAIAPNAVGSSQLAPGAVGSAQIATGAVGSTQIAGNAITGAHVADGSLTTADLADAPRAAFASGDQGLPLTSDPAVVRAVTITAPTAGKIIVNTSGLIDFADGAVVDVAYCSITTGAVVDGTHEIIVSEASATATNIVSFAGTRGFVVAPGAVTINLVCREARGSVGVYDTSLTAIFVAQ